jgi:hypothetical protein
MSDQAKVVSTQVIHCDRYKDQGLRCEALVVIFDNGKKQVSCVGGCSDCYYGERVGGD